MLRKPGVGRIVVNMTGVEQCDKYIHIQKIWVHVGSSRSRLTTSGVTVFGRPRVGRSGIPFRVRLAG